MKEFGGKSFACVLDKGDLSLLMAVRKIHQSLLVSLYSAQQMFTFCLVSHSLHT